MKQIIPIGGGAFQPGTIEKYLLDHSGPRVLFLPQASREDPNYIVKFYQVFGALGAKPSHLSLFGRVPRDYAKVFLEQDLIYVGGGNTRSLLALWREWGIDQLLKEALNRGTVLAGVSAGAICWFEQGITDSVWPLDVMPCLNFLPGSCCPHYDKEPERRPAYIDMINSGQAIPGIALQDFAAAHYIDGKLHKVIGGGKAFHLSPDSEEPI